MASEMSTTIEALQAARRFIKNGIDCGRIIMPDTPDSAHDTLPLIERALAELAAASPADADAAEMKRQRDLLGQAIADAAKKAGIYNGEVTLNGPMLLMMCDHLVDAALAHQASYPLPDDLYPGSKDWLAGSYRERVEWLHSAYESSKQELERLESALAHQVGGADSERLDWLEAWANKSKAKSHKWDTFMFDFVRYKTVREAIDAAMKSDAARTPSTDGGGRG